MRTATPIDTIAAIRPTPDHGELALVLTGGGARGAYQVGVLRSIARRFPSLKLPIITGVSAGAVNAAHLANHRGTLLESLDSLRALWCTLSPDRVFHVDTPSLARSVGRWGWQLLGGRILSEQHTRGLVDTAPLGRYLHRALGPSHDGELTAIEANIARGALRAIALTSTDYSTGQSVTWVQGRDIETWERPMRRAVSTKLTLQHVMASAALPFFFPAVALNGSWHGDGGIRLTAPLSPALHLGASRILAISTRYEPNFAEANRQDVHGYPPPAQVLGVLYNAIFLDLIDQDVVRLERANSILRELSEEQRAGMRVVDICVVRPSQDLGRVAAEYESRLPKTFRFLTRNLGTRETATPDLLSLILFQGDYLRRLIEIGERDGDARAEELGAFLVGDGTGTRAAAS